MKGWGRAGDGAGGGRARCLRTSVDLWVGHRNYGQLILYLWITMRSRSACRASLWLSRAGVLGEEGRGCGGWPCSGGVGGGATGKRQDGLSRRQTAGGVEQGSRGSLCTGWLLSRLAWLGWLSGCGVVRWRWWRTECCRTPAHSPPAAAEQPWLDGSLALVWCGLAVHLLSFANFFCQTAGCCRQAMPGRTPTWTTGPRWPSGSATP